MGSLDEPKKVIGEYMLPVIGPQTENSDPWKRNYFQPPPLEPLAPRRFPLTDVRPLLSHPNYSPLDLLQTHGFGVVKHDSPFLASLDGDVSQTGVENIYDPEVKKLVVDTLGAKKAFVMTTVLRQGKSKPEPFKLPKGLIPASPTTSASKDEKGKSEGKESAVHNQPFTPSLAKSGPIRSPHRDYTQLGARKTLRMQEDDISTWAEQSGVIAAEDRICASQSLDAMAEEADALLAEHYNSKGKLGPRYAVFSIWRPLKKVGRDPITLSPRKESSVVKGSDFINWPYFNRVPGYKGDWLKQYALLGCRDMDAPPEDETDGMEWWYLSQHMSDEVLFIKLFDTASLGSESLHAGAPWHASPEIFDAAGSQEPRESIECRVLVFW